MAHSNNFEYTPWHNHATQPIPEKNLDSQSYYSGNRSPISLQVVTSEAFSGQSRLGKKVLYSKISKIYFITCYQIGSEIPLLMKHVKQMKGPTLIPGNLRLLPAICKPHNPILTCYNLLCYS